MIVSRLFLNGEKIECENFPIRTVYLLKAQCRNVQTVAFSYSLNKFCDSLPLPHQQQKKARVYASSGISIELHHIYGQRNFHSCGFIRRTMRWIFIGNSSSCACSFAIHPTIAGFSTHTVSQSISVEWMMARRGCLIRGSFFSTSFSSSLHCPTANLIMNQIQWSARNVSMAAIFLLYENWIFTFDFILFLLGFFFCHRRKHWLNFNSDDFFHQTTTVTLNDNLNVWFRIILCKLNFMSNPQKSIVSVSHIILKIQSAFWICSMRQTKNTIFIHFSSRMNRSHIFMICTVGRDFALKLVII